MPSPEAIIVFPHQLFKQHPAITKNRNIFLLEDPLYFSQFAFHKQKLVLHRASMKQYEAFLQQQGCRVLYYENEQLHDYQVLFRKWHAAGVRKLFCCDVVDDWLYRKISEAAVSAFLELEVLPSPSFLSDETWLNEVFRGKKNYFFTDFYVQQRKRLNILIEQKAGAVHKPLGGKWTFDTENRKRLPREHQPPDVSITSRNNSASYVDEAIAYVQANHLDSLGGSENFAYPTNFEEAEDWLDGFLEQRFRLFGDYEDAISKDYQTIYHSVLTPALNIGLLTPDFIVERALQYAEIANIPLNSLEGFIRQVIGWREYMRAIYLQVGRRQRLSNYWQHSRPMPLAFYEGRTGIEPFDNVVRKLNQTGYCHHIERLMVLGNLMLLCEIDPRHVYRWFMEFFIDSYDWVMVPNVFGMSQFADGGLITTKPYISSSNYILKMSDYHRADWCQVWDGLFWRFIDNHRDYFKTNPRMSVMVSQIEKMPAEKLKTHLANAEEFLSKLV